jgi:hypothetical protein
VGSTVTLEPDTVPTLGEMLRLEASDTTQLNEVLCPASMDTGCAVKLVMVGGPFVARLPIESFEVSTYALWLATPSLRGSAPLSAQPSKANTDSIRTRDVFTCIIILACPPTGNCSSS